jgi:tetratricopeptide (TPR) repeat protein
MVKRNVTGRLMVSVAVAASLSACQTAREQEAAVKPEVAHSFLADKPVELQKHFFVALTQGSRNRVLNDMRLGLANIELGNDALAEQLLDSALGQIETIYVNNENAAKARELFTKELVKDFKGEPYERAMAYYYRGLLYLKAGDYDNARASFKGGFLQDSFADEEQNQADFGLMPYLQGWASRCRGNTVTAEDDFKEFKAIRSAFPLPGDKDNTLVLVETGSAPVKYSATDSDSTKPRYLKYRRASATETARVKFTDLVAEPPPPVKKGAKPMPAPAPKAVDRAAETALLEDVYYQASTRGGREFDSVLAGKAQFKQGANVVGDVAMAGAMVAAAVAMNTSGGNQRDSAAAAGIMLLMAVAAKAAAEAAEPDADVRYWDNLPDRVHAVTLPLPPTVTSLSVDLLASDGTLLRTREAKVTRVGPCGIAWARGESAIPANPRAPASTSSQAMFAPVVIPPLPMPETPKPAAEEAKATEPKS